MLLNFITTHKYAVVKGALNDDRFQLYCNRQKNTRGSTWCLLLLSDISPKLLTVIHHREKQNIGCWNVFLWHECFQCLEEVNNVCKCTKGGHPIRLTKVGHPIRSKKVGHPIRSAKVGHPIRSTNVGHPIRSNKVGHPIRSTKVGHLIKSTKVDHPIRSTDFVTIVPVIISMFPSTL